jgi:hypothetical protein
MWARIESVISFLSGERLLRSRPNGGGVILVRAMLIAALLFFVGVGINERLTPGASWHFDAERLFAAIREHVNWFGALFAAAYAALYARFAAQWTYLAGLYNQIMNAQTKAPKIEGSSPEQQERNRVYNNWMAGFIEDAENVHLALKPLYVGVIKSMLADHGVRDAYIRNTAGGARRLAALERKLDAVAALEEAKWVTPNSEKQTPSTVSISSSGASSKPVDTSGEAV